MTDKIIYLAADTFKSETTKIMKIRWQFFSHIPKLPSVMRPTYTMIFKCFVSRKRSTTFNTLTWLHWLQLTWHDTILHVFDLLEYQISLMNKLIFLVSKGFIEFIWEKKIIHGWIWNFSSRVHLDISLIRCAHSWAT